MITHFSKLQLSTVSVQGIKQFYHDQLQFPVIYQSEDEIRFQPTEYFTLTFREELEPLSPAHIAFQVPYSEFHSVIKLLEERQVPLLKSEDGTVIDQFDHGKNVYFRDCDGNLLEIIAHDYIREDVLSPSGALKILYLREIGFPVDDVHAYRELLMELLDFKPDRIFEHFSFAIGGTAHAVIPWKHRKWVPIAMYALPTAMTVGFGAADSAFIQTVKDKLGELGISYEENSELCFKLHEYTYCLHLSEFPKELPRQLNLPHSQ